MRTTPFVINGFPQKGCFSYHLLRYDNQIKWLKCCNSTTGWCYTSRNVVFAKASSWWSSEDGTLSSSNILKDELKIVSLSLGETEDIKDDDEDEHGTTQNPWQSGVYRQPNEEGEEDNSTPPRRGQRIRKQNPKYANAVIVNEAAEEAETFKEAS
ncbi:hypothetical protein FXO38_26576 [Capsicum annuum]|uniref:Uncharacterized protein n=1 Tax=Capsicum annuum TaxID=4072 RepID=A0A2G3AJT5_CAPAN|nr:hypothetical protein FXO38_26576 [Capsicum annuum]PHT94423.1 hypothetical protein T459_02305 [Capsicum annuum]